MIAPPPPLSPHAAAASPARDVLPKAPRRQRLNIPLTTLLVGAMAALAIIGGMMNQFLGAGPTGFEFRELESFEYLSARIKAD